MAWELPYNMGAAIKKKKEFSIYQFHFIEKVSLTFNLSCTTGRHGLQAPFSF